MQIRFIKINCFTSSLFPIEEKFLALKHARNGSDHIPLKKTLKNPTRIVLILH